MYTKSEAMKITSSGVRKARFSSEFQLQLQSFKFFKTKIPFCFLDENSEAEVSTSV